VLRQVFDCRFTPFWETELVRSFEPILFRYQSCSIKLPKRRLPGYSANCRCSMTVETDATLSSSFRTGGRFRHIPWGKLRSATGRPYSGKELVQHQRAHIQSLCGRSTPEGMRLDVCRVVDATSGSVESAPHASFPSEVPHLLRVTAARRDTPRRRRDFRTL
jgi:hypothetical protein